jgi:hypothetical protein
MRRARGCIVAVIVVFLLQSLSFGQSGERCVCRCYFSNDAQGRPVYTPVFGGCTTGASACSCPASNCVKDTVGDDACKAPRPDPTIQDCGAAAPAPLEDGNYELKSTMNLHAPQGECIDLDSSGSGSPGGRIQHLDCRGNGWQVWHLQRRASDGCYAIVHNAGAQPARCLDVKSQDANDAGGTRQWYTCNGSSNQYFQSAKFGAKVRIASKRNGLCIDLRDQERQSGGRVQTMFCNGTANQDWKAKKQ